MPLEIDISSVRWSSQGEPTPSLELNVAVLPTGDARNADWAFGNCFPAFALGRPNASDGLSLPIRLERMVQPLVRAGSTERFVLTFRIETPFDALEQIERRRVGEGDLRGSLQLHVALFRAHPRAGASDMLLGEPVYFFPSQVHGSQLTLSRDEWLRLLRTMRFTDVLVMEFPARFVGDSPSPRLVAARGELDLARRAYHELRYDDAAVHSRKALDALVSDGRGSLAERIVAAHFGRAPAEVQQRVRAAIGGALRVYQLGPHAVGDDAFPAVNVTRQLASFVVGTAQLIVGWCGEELSAEPA